MLRIGAQCPPSHAVLHLPTPDGGTRSSTQNALLPSQQGTVCLSCFVDSLQIESPRPSMDVVRRSAVAIMEALVHHCPTTDQGEGVLLSWTLDWLTFGPTTSPCAAPAFSAAMNVPSPHRIGNALADVIVALYAYVARCGGGLGGGGSSSGATVDAVGPTIAGDTAAPSFRSLGHDAEDVRWVVLVDLVQFLFSCWELLLLRRPTPSTEQAMSSQVGMRTLALQETSMQCGTAFLDYSQAHSVPLPPQVLLGEADDSVPGDSLQRHDSNENIALVTANALHDIVLRVVQVLFHAVEEDTTAIDTGLDCSLLQSPAAATTFLKLVQASSVLRQVVRSSPLLLRSLMRYLLPRLLALHHRQQAQQQHRRHLFRERGGSNAVVVRAIEVLIFALHLLASSTALPNTVLSSQPLSTLASQLSCRCYPSGFEVIPPSVLADSDGATLLQTLRTALQSSCEMNSVPLRLHVLRLLYVLSSSPATRRALFSPHCGSRLSRWSARPEEDSEPTSAATVVSAQSSSAWDLARCLLPLLLSGEDEEETVQLTCSVLGLMLLQVQSPCLPAPFAGQYDGPVLETSTAAGDSTAAFTEDRVVGTLDDVSDIQVTAQLANHVKDYVMQALYSCTRKTGNALVVLLDRATSVAAGVRALLRGANAEAEASVQNDDTGVQWSQRQDWRVIFHVAEVDMSLFEVLVKGAALHDALVLPHCADADTDGSEIHLVWDEVASSIVAVAAPDRDVQLSLYGLLRCLDALGDGMQGNTQALWSNRLGQLMHELLRRVGGHLEGGCLQPVDSRAAVRRFSALLISGASDLTCNRESFATSSLQGARDADDPLLLRRRVDPGTLYFLTRVTAAYLPTACDLLTPLGVQLLTDVTQTGELIAMGCPAPSGYPTRTSACVEESRCLLRIAALLTKAQFEHRAHRGPPYVSVEGQPQDARNGEGTTSHLFTAPSNPIFGPSYLPRGTYPRSGGPKDDDNRAGLLDTLFGLFPEAPELLTARVELIHALTRSHTEANARPEHLPTHASSFMGAASLTEVVMCAGNLQAQLLLSLATLGCPSFVSQQELGAMLENKGRVLCSRLLRTAPSESTRVPAALWPADVATYGDPLDPAVADVIPDGVDMALVIDVLIEVFTLHLLHTLWYSGTDTNPPRLKPARGTVVGDDGAVADRPFAETCVQGLMMCVESSVEVRRDVCQFLFKLHEEYRVDVCSFLTRLQHPQDQTSLPLLQRTQVPPSPALFSAALLSVVLYERSEPHDLTTSTDEVSPLSAYMRTLRAVHWLTNASLQQASVTSTVNLFLKSVFRVAQKEYLSLDCRPHPRGQQDDGPSAPTATLLTAIEGLQFVYAELASQHQDLLDGYFTVRHTGTERAPNSGSGLMLSVCVLREHLLPFLLRTDGSSAADRNNVLFSVEALEYTTVLLRLISIALWPLGPATCTSLDAVLAEYTMSRVRQLLSLTTSEMICTDGAAGKLLVPLLQMLYLLLTRAHRADVLRRYGKNLLLFACMARHAAITRAKLLASGDLGQSTVGCFDVSSVQVCVVSSIVCIMAQQTVHPKRERSVTCAAMGATGEDGCTGSSGAEGVSVTGMVPSSPKDVPWHEWIPVFCYYGLLRTSASHAASDCSTREQRQGVLWLVLSGVEYVIRLCGVSKLSCCGHGATSARLIEAGGQHRRGARIATDHDVDPSQGEEQAAAILIDWCAEVIFTSYVNRDDTFKGACLGVATVAARLLYLLFHRFCTLATNSSSFNALVLGCMRPAGPSQLLQLPLVAEGWLLAALIHVMPNVQHWCAYENYVSGSVASFFEKLEIAGQARLPPHMGTSEEATTSDPVRPIGEEGSWADVSVLMPEVRCALHVLVTTCRRYELSLHRLRCDRLPSVIIPLGCPFAGNFFQHNDSSLLEYVFPYTVIPQKTLGVSPLLLVFRCTADQINE